MYKLIYLNKYPDKQKIKSGEHNIIGFSVMKIVQGHIILNDLNGTPEMSLLDKTKS